MLKIKTWYKIQCHPRLCFYCHSAQIRSEIIMNLVHRKEILKPQSIKNLFGIINLIIKTANSMLCFVLGTVARYMQILIHLTLQATI